MTTIAPPPVAKKAAPPPPKATNGKPMPEAESKDFTVVSGRTGGAERILIFGPGGIGKSTLAGLAPRPVFIDLEEGTRKLDVNRMSGIGSLADVRACLNSSALDGFQTIVVDSVTRAEDLAIAHTLATIQHDQTGRPVSNIEGYGWGKGYQHVYDTFLLLLADLDNHFRAGRNVILIAHDCIANVPNPVSEDYIRYEPHLQSPKSGKASIRNRVIQWADYVLFLGYDVISKDGKGKGGSTRTIFTVERPDHIAKCRTPIAPMPFKGSDDNEIWNAIFNGGKA